VRVSLCSGACRYHVIHHTKREANFCLFMPLFDLLGGTLDARSWEMQEKTSAGTDTANLHLCFLVCVCVLRVTCHQTNLLLLLGSYRTLRELDWTSPPKDGC